MTLLAVPVQASEGAFWGFGDTRVPFHGLIWQTPLADSSDDAHRISVARILHSFEQTTGRSLAPGSRGRAAIKVYANSGPGLQTPPALTRAVIHELLKRGFGRDQLMIIDAREDMLRAAGYLPPLSRMRVEGPYFDGVHVFALDEGSLLSPIWYYESPLPREFTSPIGRMLLRPTREVDPTEARRSYLPSKLLTEVDFWINLPVACHHPAMEMSGAMVNASLWNITNNTRFFSSPANAPVAIAEIAAIPEILDTWALNIVSLMAFQYIGGPAFNANYTDSLPQLWASVDPVILDVALTGLLNSSRRRNGFRPLSSVPEFVELAVQLGVGFGLPAQARIQPLVD